MVYTPMKCIQREKCVHTICGLAVEVLDVHAGSLLSQGPHCVLLFPADGSMEWCPALRVLNIEVDAVLREEEV